MNNNNNNNQTTCGNHAYKQMAGSSNIFCPCCGDIKSPESQKAKLEKVKCEREVNPFPSQETKLEKLRQSDHHLLGLQISTLVIECIDTFARGDNKCVIPLRKYSLMEGNLLKFTECLEIIGFSLWIRQGSLISDREFIIEPSKVRKSVVV